MKVVTDGVEIIIATPGRLNDLVEAGCIQIESVTYLVLDEVILLRIYLRYMWRDSYVLPKNPFVIEKFRRVNIQM